MTAACDDADDVIKWRRCACARLSLKAEGARRKPEQQQEAETESNRKIKGIVRKL